jgi:hypothetical protein
MKLLLDECVPRRFSSSLSSDVHQCLTVPEAGFAGKTNGELLALAEAGFDVFITLDRGFAYQQNLAGRKIAYSSHSHKLNAFGRLAPACGRLPPGLDYDQARRDRSGWQREIGWLYAEQAT